MQQLQTYNIETMKQMETVEQNRHSLLEKCIHFILHHIFYKDHIPMHHTNPSGVHTLFQRRGSHLEKSYPGPGSIF